MEMQRAFQRVLLFYKVQNKRRRDNRFQSTSVIFEMSEKNMVQELSVSIDAIGSSLTELTAQTPAIPENQYPLLVSDKENSIETDSG